MKKTILVIFVGVIAATSSSTRQSPVFSNSRLWNNGRQTRSIGGLPSVSLPSVNSIPIIGSWFGGDEEKEELPTIPNLSGYPLWRVHKYNGIALRPVPPSQFQQVLNQFPLEGQDLNLSPPAPSIVNFAPPSYSPGESLPQSYGPPAETYGPPAETYGPPAETYGPPAQTYGPPAQTYGPPAQTYGPPAQTYGPPAQTYGPPPDTYEPPPQTYGPPAQMYVPPPAQTYGPPAQMYGPPAQTYGPPAETYGPPPKPASTYGPPAETYGIYPRQPATTYGTTNPEFSNQADFTAQINEMGGPGTEGDSASALDSLSNLGASLPGSGNDNVLSSIQIFANAVAPETLKRFQSIISTPEGRERVTAILGLATNAQKLKSSTMKSVRNYLGSFAGGSNFAGSGTFTNIPKEYPQSPGFLSRLPFFGSGSSVFPLPELPELPPVPKIPGIPEFPDAPPLPHINLPHLPKGPVVSGTPYVSIKSPNFIQPFSNFVDSNSIEPQSTAEFQPISNPYASEAPYPSQAPYAPEAPYPSEAPYAPEAPYPSEAPYAPEAPYPSEAPYAPELPYPPPAPFETYGPPVNSYGVPADTSSQTFNGHQTYQVPNQEYRQISSTFVNPSNNYVVPDSFASASENEPVVLAAPITETKREEQRKKDTGYSKVSLQRPENYDSHKIQKKEYGQEVKLREYLDRDHPAALTSTPVFSSPRTSSKSKTEEVSGEKKQSGSS